MRISFATEAGSSAKPSEDAVAASASVVVVVDGVTAPPGLPTGCVHGTPWYANMLAAQIVSAVSATPDVLLKNALAQAIGRVADSHGDRCDLTAAGTPSGTVAILREYAGTLDYLVLSDATVAIETANGMLVVADRRVEEAAGELSRSVKELAIGDESRPARLSRLVEAQRQLRNVPGGYWLAGVVPEAAEHSLTGSVSTREVVRAAAMTDGASCLVDLYEYAGWDEGMAELAHVGPAGWLTRVRKIEASDPDATRWPRYKRGDDATIAVIEV